VLNGCTDNTLGVVQAVAKGILQRQLLNFPEPIGKGGALIEGLKLAPYGDLIGYTDADGATPPRAFLELVGTPVRRTASSARAGCPARSSTSRRPGNGDSPAARFT
jgi:glycosyltransferase involved in cell wall biosynthesis